jgi:hypothetical protein
MMMLVWVTHSLSAAGCRLGRRVSSGGRSEVSYAYGRRRYFTRTDCSQARGRRGYLANRSFAAGAITERAAFSRAGSRSRP